MIMRLPGPFLLPDPLPDQAGHYLPIAARLTQEVAGWCEESARLVPEADGGWEDEGTVLVGLLVRVAKMLRRMARALDEDDGEAAEIFSRCIFESVVNARVLFLANENGQEMAKKFIKAGFVPEELIRKQLESRDPDSLAPDEREVLEGLKSWAFTHEIPPNIQGLGQMKDRLGRSALDGQSVIYWWAMPSQAVHGSWVNLQNYHLELTDHHLWVPRFESGDPPPVLPMAMVEHAWAIVVDYLPLRAPSEWPVVAESAEHVSMRLQAVHAGLARALGLGGDP